MGKQKEFYLDLKRDKVFGFENPRSSLLVATMVEGIKSGCEFPAICIDSSIKDFYAIFDGHHRALAHYIEDSLCKCIFNGVLQKKHRKCVIPLGSIVLEDLGYEFIGKRLKDSLSYLSRDVAEIFCRKNNLDVNEYLSQ